MFPEFAEMGQRQFCRLQRALWASSGVYITKEKVGRDGLSVEVGWTVALQSVNWLRELECCDGVRCSSNGPYLHANSFLMVLYSDRLTDVCLVGLLVCLFWFFWGMCCCFVCLVFVRLDRMSFLTTMTTEARG